MGIERREKCVYVADENTADDVIDALRDEGMDVGAAVESGSLTVASKRETTLKEGRLVPEKLIRFWADTADAARAAGFSGLRIVAEMTWALHHDPGTERLIEFEAKVNDLVRNHPIVGICQYNRRSFAPEVILNVIRTHPLVFIEGLVCRNPYYIPPQEFLAPHHAEREVERLLTNIRDRERAENALRASEEALRESETRFRQVAENINEVFWLSNPEATLIHYVSPAYEKIWGRSCDSLRADPMSWMDSIHPDDRERIAEGVRLQSVRGRHDHTYRIVRPDGALRWIRDRAFPVRDESGKLIRVAGVAKDITERKEAEDRLRRSEEKFKALFGIAPVGISVLDRQHNIADANPALEQITRLSKEELLNGTWRRRTYLNADGTPKPLNELPSEHAVTENRPINDIETGIVTEDGGIIWTLVSVAPLALPDASAVVITQDITERKLAAKELEEANHQLRLLSRRLFDIQEEERRHLARELHDEIGQTLTAAKLNLKIIAPDVPPAVAGRLEDSIQLLDRLLQQVRELSLDLRPPLLDDLGLVPALRWLADQQAQRAGLRVTFAANVERLEMAPPLRTACFRVVQEAITNALRHARAATVAVELRAEPDRVWLVVKDDGAGFDKDAMQQRAARGASLGLLSMKERVSLLGGELEVNSAPGCGAEIRAWLPLAAPGPDVSRATAGRLDDSIQLPDWLP